MYLLLTLRKEPVAKQGTDQAFTRTQEPVGKWETDQAYAKTSGTCYGAGDLQGTCEDMGTCWEAEKNFRIDNQALNGATQTSKQTFDLGSDGAR